MPVSVRLFTCGLADCMLATLHCASRHSIRMIVRYAALSLYMMHGWITCGMQVREAT